MLKKDTFSQLKSVKLEGRGAPTFSEFQDGSPAKIQTANFSLSPN